MIVNAAGMYSAQMAFVEGRGCGEVTVGNVVACRSREQSLFANDSQLSRMKRDSRKLRRSSLKAIDEARNLECGRAFRVGASLQTLNARHR